jgi:glycosyltransferase involved in cell wall biosynthesis
MKPKASIIIAFYNNIDNLRIVLAGLERQTATDFEVVIADDGSRAEVVAEIKQIQQQSSLTIRHLWQEDSGWQKNVMLNKAVVAAAADYLIFIDGDCIPDDRFVAEHLNSSQLRFALCGRRVYLSNKISKALTPKSVRDGYFNKNYLRLFTTGQTRHGEKMIFARIPFIARYINKKHRDFWGCNFSIYKADLLAVNGFDERFVTPGIGEDIDVYRRLLLTGRSTKSVVASALVYHLDHKETQIPQATYDLEAITIEENTAFTPFGIEKRLA